MPYFHRMRRKIRLDCALLLIVLVLFATWQVIARMQKEKHVFELTSTDFTNEVLDFSAYGNYATDFHEQDEVWYQASGSVFHNTDSCTALSPTSPLLHSTLEEALSLYALHPCSRCYS